MEEKQFIKNDHDLLISMDGKLNRAITDIGNLAEALSEANKSYATKDEFNDHETRIRWAEQALYWTSGASAIIGGLLGYLLDHFFK